MMKFRLKFFFSHLLISILLVSVVLLLVFKVWYPHPLNIALGVTHILGLLVLIDVVLGPLLTFILAKQGKKGLKFDLMAVGLVQILALSYGVYSIEKGRPVSIAYDVNRFELVQKFMIKSQEGHDIIAMYAKEQHNSVPFAYVVPAKDEEELKQRMTDDLEHGISATMNPSLYQSINQENMQDILKNSKPVSQLSQFNDEKQVQEVLKKFPQADYFTLLVASEKNMTVLLDSKNSMPVAIVDLRPW